MRDKNEEGGNGGGTGGHTTNDDADDGGQGQMRKQVDEHQYLRLMDASRRL